MIVLATVNNRRFRLNGIEYLKNYITVVHGNRVEIFNCYERSDVLVPLTHYDQFTVNGAVYESAIELQSALLDVLYSRIMASTDAVFDQNNAGRRIVLNAVPNDSGVASIDFIQKLNTITTIITPTDSPVIIRGYIQQANDIAKTHQYLWMGGKGTFGVGGEYVLGYMLLELAPVLQDADSVVYNYGDLVNQTISQWLNTNIQVIFIQPQEYGYFIFKGTIDGVDTTYLWIGTSGDYAADALQSTDEDFQQVSDVPGGVITLTLQQVATEGSEAVIDSDFSVITTNTSFKVKNNGDFASGGSGTALLNYPIIDLGSGQVKTSHVPSAPTDVVNKSHLDGRLNTKADLVNGVVSAGQLPGYVDDVLEFATLAAFPATGESGKLYIAVNTNLVYRWGGSAYVVTSSSLALGETSVTAYRGDRGKTAYDHSQLITGNPHGTTIADISGLQTAINAKLTGTLANDSEAQITYSITEDNKVISRLKLYNWWTWIKTYPATIAGNWNFTGTLKKSGVDVATTTDVATKLNIAANTGLAGTGIRIPKVSENGTITVDAFLSWSAATNELVIGSGTNSGKLNITSQIFELAVQDNILSGQSRILFNSAQEDALSFVDKAGNVYMTFKSITGGTGVVLKQREIFDEQVFYPLSRRQAALTSAGAGVTIYGKDSLGNIITIPFAIDTTVLFTEATLILKNSTASQVIAAKIKTLAKRVGGVTTIMSAPLEIISNNSNYSDFAAGIVAINDGLQFYFTPAPSDTTNYTGAFTEIKYTIN